MEKLKGFLIIMAFISLCLVIISLSVGVILDIWNYYANFFYKLSVSFLIVMLAFSIVLLIIDPD